MNVAELDITWDSAKSLSNIVKHGVTFAQAASVLNDPLALTVFDSDHNEVEERWFSLGMAGCWRCRIPTERQGLSAHISVLFPHAMRRAVNECNMRMNHDR